MTRWSSALPTSTRRTSRSFELVGAQLTHALRYAVGGLHRILVLPYPDHVPAFRRQALVGVSIAKPIRFDLLAPEVGVVGGPGCMLRAAMPETAIHEHHELRWTEDDVGASATNALHRAIDAEPKSASVQQASQDDLRLGVPAARARHSRADGGSRRAQLRSLRTPEGQATASRPCGVIASR